MLYLAISDLQTLFEDTVGILHEKVFVMLDALQIEARSIFPQSNVSSENIGGQGGELSKGMPQATCEKL